MYMELGDYGMKIIIIFLFVLISGCMTQTALDDALKASSSEHLINNQSLILSQGERIFVASEKSALKAFIATFAQLNMSVSNMNASIGFLAADGDPPMSPSELEDAGKANVARLNELTMGGSPWKYVGNNMLIRATVTLTPRGDDSVLIKLHFSSRIQNGNGNISNVIPTSFLSVFYTNVWREFDKQLFILQETM